MKRRQFDRLVARVIENLPEQFAALLDNVVVVTMDEPSHETLVEAGVPEGETLLGLYEGVPLTERSSEYGLVPPDRITIYQKPIEESCNSDTLVEEQIRRTVLHELAHFFGIDEARMDEIEGRWDKSDD